MLVYKEKIYTSRFFPMLYHEESPEKSQYNMATFPFLNNPPPPPHFVLPPLFYSKNFHPPPISINFGKVEPLPLRRRGLNYDFALKLFQVCLKYLIHSLTKLIFIVLSVTSLRN